MTEEQFQALAELARLPEGPTREAARLVYVHGARPSEAASQAGCLRQSVSRTLRLCRRAQELARQALGVTEQ